VSQESTGRRRSGSRNPQVGGVSQEIQQVGGGVVQEIQQVGGVSQGIQQVGGVKKNYQKRKTNRQEWLKDISNLKRAGCPQTW
jgi:hypothetical protein